MFRLPTDSKSTTNMPNTCLSLGSSQVGLTYLDTHLSINLRFGVQSWTNDTRAQFKCICFETLCSGFSIYNFVLGLELRATTLHDNSPDYLRDAFHHNYLNQIFSNVIKQHRTELSISATTSHSHWMLWTLPHSVHMCCVWFALWMANMLISSTTQASACRVSRQTLHI